jgi:uncharacterized protein YjbJ (UPF0337 family)
MDKDRVKGAINEAAGRVKRQAGEWTGNTDAQVEGAVQQIKGKTQKIVGAIKDAARNAKNDVERERAREDEQASEQELDFEQEHEDTQIGQSRR